MMSSIGGGVAHLGLRLCDSFILLVGALFQPLIAVLGDSFIPVDIYSCVKLLLT